MKATFDAFLYGGDWNPEQWDEDVWRRDVELFGKAGINEATINVFSWAQIQPGEDEYDFSVLDRIVDLLETHGIGYVMATSTGSLPAWMCRRFPDVTRVDWDGRRHNFGYRHNACPNSPNFKRLSVGIAGKLAERYGGRDGLLAWHVSNEYGGHCYCEHCAQAFRVWLKAKYGDIATLNRDWYTHFWGHTYSDFNQIEPPTELNDGLWNRQAVLSGHAIDWRRFMSESMLANYTGERDAIKAFDTVHPVTTNLMGTYDVLDLFRWGREMDVISWDSYPSWDTPAYEVAMRHDLMRGVGAGKPFMLMEQTPSQQNWQPYNSLKNPGQMRQQSWQAVAHGADTVQFFQLRQSLGGCEKFHGAVISHAGREDERVFREVAALGAELKAHGHELIGGETLADVAVMFDWESYWSVKYASGPSVELDYVDQVRRWYAALYRRNIAVDMVPADSAAEDLSKYKAVIAPCLMMVGQGTADALSAYVQGGGRLVTNVMSGINDTRDQAWRGGYPGPLRELVGVWAEEIDAFEPGREIPVEFADGHAHARMLANTLRLEGATPVAMYGEGVFYAGGPAVTVNKVGNGLAYYVGAVLDDAGLDIIINRLITEGNIMTIDLPESIRDSVEVTRRHYDGYTLTFVINHGKALGTVNIPELAGGFDILADAKVNRRGTLDLADYGVAVVRQTA